MRKEPNEQDEYSARSAITYSFGQISDITAYQTFTFLTFTFYFAVVQINVVLISAAFLFWSIWNAFNDPMLGYLSDRTHTKFGRRIPYIMLSFIPLAVIMFFIYSPPATFGIVDQNMNYIYFIIIIIIFELFYTMYSLNLTSLFPEIFISLEDRTRANNIRQTFAIFGLIMAFILPSFFISDFSDPANLAQYQTFGIVVMVIIIVTSVIFLKFGPKERAEFQNDYKNAPNFFTSIKNCVQSKSFMWYIPAEVANWFVYGMLPTIVPLYGKFVLGIENTLLLSLLLGFTFISAAIFMNIFWKPVVQKIGPRKAWILSMSIWIITLFPLLLISDMIAGIIVFFLMGIGFSGSLYIIDLIVSDIIDEDEVKTGTRREAGYYGVNALFLRFSTVFVFLAISLVFTNVGWAVFEPDKITPDVIFGLRALMFIFPAIALSIGILAIIKYPLDNERLKEVKKKLETIHSEKKSKSL